MTTTAIDIPAAPPEAPARPRHPLNVALLLSCDTFESFFGDVLKLDRDRYLASYRNDWSWYYAQGLIDNGIRPTLYLPSVRYAGLHHTDAGVDVRFLPTAGWYRPIAKLRRAFRATRWSLYAQEQVNAAAFHPALTAALVEDGIDVLYHQDYWNGRFDYLAARARLPLVAMDHGGIPDGVVKVGKRRAFARAAAILCQTRDECRQVERYGARPLLQPNGCETDYFHPPADPAEKSKTILTIARLTDKQKRTSDLIRALPLLDASWSLDIVGTGPDMPMLQALAGALGVSGRVRFRGFQGRAEVREFCRRCGVYAMPSSNEAICLAMLEAMGCGAAVVATRIRAFETIIADGATGLLVPVGDPPALAAAIGRAWVRRDTLGPAAAESVARDFDNRRLYRQLADRLRAAAAAAVAA
jgi:glycosyltransferase involved in cell wall biosynthesis